MSSLFISAMALKQDNKDLQTQEAQFREMFLNLYKGQEELRAIINQLHQDGYNSMKQTVEAGDQVIDLPPRRKKVVLVKSGPFQIATTSRVQ